MIIACLIQGDSWVPLKNLLASHNGASIVTANLADQNVSPKIGDASLVIDGEEFVAHVVAHTKSRIIFEADRFDEIAEKTFLKHWSWGRTSKNSRFSRGKQQRFP